MQIKLELNKYFTGYWSNCITYYNEHITIDEDSLYVAVNNPTVGIPPSKHLYTPSVISGIEANGWVYIGQVTK